MTDPRFTEWLIKAKERAYAMEQLAPLARKSKAKAPAQPLSPAYPDWLSPTAAGKVVIQDPPLLIEGMATDAAQTWVTMVRRIQAGKRPQKGFRSFHGKDRAA